jgi:hypothetical protein
MGHTLIAFSRSSTQYAIQSAINRAKFLSFDRHHLSIWIFAIVPEHCIWGLSKLYQRIVHRSICIESAHWRTHSLVLEHISQLMVRRLLYRTDDHTTVEWSVRTKRSAVCIRIRSYFFPVALIIGNTISLFASTLRCLSIFIFAPELLIVGRVFASLSSAIAYSSLVLFLQETSPTQLRGQLTSLSEVSFAITCLIGMVLGMDVLLGQVYICFVQFLLNSYSIPLCYSRQHSYLVWLQWLPSCHFPKHPDFSC